nr:enoyl-CoA hydratase/isomerase family protein [Anaerolineae bacterium]
MAYEFIITEVHDRAGLIRLNRPQALNALNSSLMAELGNALLAFDADAQIGAVVITGSDRAFAAGADIKEMADASAVDMLRSDLIGPWDIVTTIKKPVMAAVSGFALGGGCELAMMCDMIVASETAVFGQPEINLGVIPGAGGTQRLVRAVGKALAMEIILNDRRLTAEEAYRFGLVNRVYPVDSYLEEALNLANSIGARAPIALQLAKESINKAFEMTLTEGLVIERRNFYFLFASEDQKEGMDAFVNKRQPQWKGK